MYVRQLRPSSWHPRLRHVKVESAREALVTFGVNVTFVSFWGLKVTFVSCWAMREATMILLNVELEVASCYSQRVSYSDF
jgi:hypothetical protein